MLRRHLRSADRHGAAIALSGKDSRTVVRPDDAFRVKAIVGSFEPRRSQSSEERLKSTVALAAFQQALWRDEEHALAIAPRWPPSAHPRSCCALATSKRSPAGCSAPHHQGPYGASHGAHTGGSSASNNTTPRAPTHTPRHRRPSTARAPGTNSRRAQLKRLHHPPEASVWGCGKPACRNHAECERDQTQSGRTAQPGRSRLTRPCARTVAGRTTSGTKRRGEVGPIGSHQRRR